MAERVATWLLFAALGVGGLRTCLGEELRALKPELRLQMSPGGSCGAFSPDGRFVATGGVLWETSTGREIRTVGPDTGIDAVAFSPDAHYVAGVCSIDTTVRMWETGSGKEVWKVSGGTAWAGALAFTPDGRFVVTGGNDHLVRLLDAATGKELRKFAGHDAYTVACVTISKDGRRLLSGSSDATARLWELDTGKELRRTPEQAGRVRAVAFSPDARLFLTSAYDNKAYVWDTTTMERLRSFEANEEVWSVAFAPTGDRVVTGGAQHVTVWETATGKRLRDLPRSLDTTYAVAFSPDGRLILGAGLGSAAWLWDAATGNITRVLESAAFPPAALAYSPDGRHLLVGSTGRASDSDGANDKSQGAIYVWDLAIGRSVRSFARLPSPVTALAFSNDGKIVAAGTKEGQVRTLQFSNGKTRRELKAPHAIDKLALAANGRIVAATERYNIQKIHLWDEASGKELDSYLDGDAISPDGRYVLTSSLNARFLEMGPADQLAAYSRLDTFARLFDMATGQEVKRFGPNAGVVFGRAFSPDGQFVLTGARNSPYRLWEVDTGREAQRFPGLPGSGGGPVAFSPDGKLVLAGKESDFVQRDKGWLAFWERATGKQLARIETSAKWAWFLPDNRRVISLNIYREASFWDATTGKKLNEINLHTAMADALAISPDARFIAAGYFDKSVLLYDTETAKEVCTLVNFKDGSQAVIEPDGRFDSANLEEPLRLSWLMPDDPMRPLGPEIFLRDYYEPHLLPRLVQAERFPPVRPLADLNRAQPQVRIASIRLEDGSQDSVAVTLELARGEYQFSREGQAIVHRTDVYDVRLFRDGQLVGRLPDTETLASSEPKPGDLSEAALRAWQKAYLVKPEGSSAPTGMMRHTFRQIKLPHSRPAQPLGFSAYAFNADRVKGETARSSFTLPQAAATGRPRAYLIAMGVNACQDPNWDLWFAAAGARELQKLLDERIRQLGRYEIVPVTLISDYEEGEAALVEKTATKSALKQTLEELAGRGSQRAGRLRAATPDDLVLVYLSSHGYAAPDGTFYCVPFDIGEPAGVSEEQLTAALSGQTTPGSAVRAAALAFLARCISSEELTQWLRRIDAGQMTLILDSCHAAEVTGRAFKPGPMGDRGFGQLAYDKAMRVLAATQADNVALGPLVLKQSLLTHALLHPTLEGNSFDLKEWLQQAVDQVPQLCLKHYPGFSGKVQRPVLFDYDRTSHLAAEK